MFPKKKRIPDNPWDPPSYWARDPNPVLDSCAPEHVRDALSMVRDYPRDEWGNRIPDSRRDIVVDPRPTILVPPRPTYKNK